MWPVCRGNSSSNGGLSCVLAQLSEDTAVLQSDPSVACTYRRGIRPFCLAETELVFSSSVCLREHERVGVCTCLCVRVSKVPHSSHNLDCSKETKPWPSREWREKMRCYCSSSGSLRWPVCGGRTRQPQHRRGRSVPSRWILRAVSGICRPGAVTGSRDVQTDTLGGSLFPFTGLSVHPSIRLSGEVSSASALMSFFSFTAFFCVQLMIFAAFFLDLISLVKPAHSFSFYQRKTELSELLSFLCTVTAFRKLLAVQGTGHCISGLLFQICFRFYFSAFSVYNIVYLGLHTVFFLNYY